MKTLISAAIVGLSTPALAGEISVHSVPSLTTLVFDEKLHPSGAAYWDQGGHVDIEVRGSRGDYTVTFYVWRTDAAVVHSGRSVPSGHLVSHEGAVQLGLGASSPCRFPGVGEPIWLAGQEVVCEVDSTQVAVEFIGDANDNSVALIDATSGNSLSVGRFAATGGQGDDTIQVVGGFESVVEGGPGDDALIGGDGTDTLSGGIGEDTLDGGGGRDTLHGGIGDDHLYGGDGDDTIDAVDGNGTDFIGCGLGYDTLMADEGDAQVDCP